MKIFLNLISFDYIMYKNTILFTIIGVIIALIVEFL